MSTRNLPVQSSVVVFFVGTLALLLFVWGGCSRSVGDVPPARNETEANLGAVPSCSRVVSLAPSLTEMVYVLGLEQRLIGATRFCSVKGNTVARVGGYTDPSYERILSLQPDVVILTELHDRQKADLKKLRISTLTLRTGTLGDIFQSLSTLANTCGVGTRGTELVNRMKNELARVAATVKGQPRHRVLISVGRSMGTGSIQDIFAAGRDTWFNELIELAGGENVIRDTHVMYPKLSAEGVMSLNPEVIVELVPEADQKHITQRDIVRQWSVAAQVSAVQKGRVHLLRDSNVAQPGPHVVELAQKLALLFHPQSPDAAGALAAKKEYP